TGSRPSRTVMSFAVYVVISESRSGIGVRDSRLETVYQTRTKSTSGTRIAPPNSWGKERMGIVNISLKTGLAIALIIVAHPVAAHEQMRVQDMDRNGDGVITRDEWRGTDRAFRDLDWNNDGVLSGDEIRYGNSRPFVRNGDWNQDGVVDRQDALIAQRFRSID